MQSGIGHVTVLTGGETQKKGNTCSTKNTGHRTTSSEAIVRRVPAICAVSEKGVLRLDIDFPHQLRRTLQLRRLSPTSNLPTLLLSHSSNHAS
jgi:hypothetical protein